MRIKTTIQLSVAAMAAMVATPGTAADLGNGVSVSGSVAVVSDYRFRGISQTDKRFAIQGGFTVAHESGFYLSTWGSSIDDYVYNGSDQEIDIIGGWSKTYGAATVDVGVLYYYYPGSGGINSDFFEPYASVKGTIGPVTAKVTANYAPKQAAIGLGSQVPGGGPKKDNLYLAGDFSTTFPDTNFTLSAHIGHTWGPSVLVPSGDNYTDWNVGVSYPIGPISVGVQYVDTNKDFITPSGRNAAKAGVVGTISVGF